MKSRVLLAAAVLMAAGLAAQAAPAPLKGEVLEVQNVEGYTYLRAKTKDGDIWAAVPAAPLKKGAQITLYEPMVMTNFESKGLKRKFDKIVFASLEAPGAKQAAPAAAGPANPHGTSAPAAAAVPVGKIAKATGADGKTVEEVIANKTALKDKTVSIRGQVVKVNSGILGKNWIHLQDGSGAAAKGTNDLIVTTTDEARVGDVVLASGTVKTDVNVGSGYAYAVLVDQAKLRK